MANLTRSFWLPAGVMLVVVSATTYPLCGALFSCGCTMTGASHCNVHHATGPHCPWCAGGGGAVGAANFAVMLAATFAGITLARRVGGPRWWVGVIGGSVAYLASAILAGWVTARLMGYPIHWGTGDYLPAGPIVSVIGMS